MSEEVKLEGDVLSALDSSDVNESEELELVDTEIEDTELEDTEIEEGSDEEEIELVEDGSEEEESEEEESEEVEYGGEDGRQYSQYETVGTQEIIRGDNGVLRIYHKDDSEEDGEDTQEEYESRLVEYTDKIQAGGIFEGFEGEPISPRIEDGTHRLGMLPIDGLVFLGGEDERLRSSSLELVPLETSIREVGQIEPIVVVPLGSPVGYETDENGEDIEEMPIHRRYQVIHGRRRVEAMANLGFEYIEAIIDTTLPRELLEFYQATATTTKELTFSEKMAYIERMRLAQPEMSPDLLEASVGFKFGELPKAEFVDSHQAEYAEVYLKVEKEKLTIEQGFKQISKEIEKKEKEEEKAMQEALEGSEGQDVEDALREQQDQADNALDEMANTAGTQELGDRKILDTAIRRSVEARDNSECQVCGYAHGVPERADNLKAHHMVAVQYGGSDALNNLIMLCNNCHEEVHKYESGRQIYNKETFDRYDEVKRIVVLGNILRRARVKAIEYIRGHDSTIGKRMDRGDITVGRALKELNVNLGIEQTFENDSPYQAFKESTSDLDYGGGLTGDLAEVWEFDDEKEIIGDADENIDEPEDAPLVEVEESEDEDEEVEVKEVEVEESVVEESEDSEGFELEDSEESEDEVSGLSLEDFI